MTPDIGELLRSILVACGGGLVASLSTALILVGKFNTRLAVAENQVAMIAALSNEIKDLSKSVGSVSGRVGVLEAEHRGFRENMHDTRTRISEIQAVQYGIKPL